MSHQAMHTGERHFTCLTSFLSLPFLYRGSLSKMVHIMLQKSLKLVLDASHLTIYVSNSTFGTLLDKRGFEL